MNILIVHQNHPGQYREIAPRLVRDGHQVIFLTQRHDPGPNSYPLVVYKPDRKAPDDSYTYTSMYESAMGAGVGALKAARKIAETGFVPDIIVGHAGWGELVFLKEVWPRTPILGYFEYFFIAKGGLINFDPEFQSGPDISAKLIARNGNNILNLVNCDAHYTATPWQRDVHPLQFRGKIEVVHEGVRTDLLLPDHTSPIDIKLPHVTLTRHDEVVTYIARSLEPARGVHVVLRSLPRLQRLRPKAHIVVIGTDGVSYGAKLAGGQSFKDMLLAELGNAVDWSRVHFVGHVAYRDLVNLLRLARCHIYMTVPFVISWSLLEAMALEKTIIASDVAPVRQFITPGKTGLLVDFFDPAGLADQVADVLAHRDFHREIGTRARQFIQAHYDFETVCYPQFLKLVETVLLGRRTTSPPLRSQTAQAMRTGNAGNALPMPEAEADSVEEGWQDF